VHVDRFFPKLIPIRHDAQITTLRDDSDGYERVRMPSGEKASIVIGAIGLMAVVACIGIYIYRSQARARPKIAKRR
jgi:hypothetical protein